MKKVLFVNTSYSAFTPGIIKGLKELDFEVNFFDHFSPNLFSKFLGFAKNRGLLKAFLDDDKFNLYLNELFYKKVQRTKPDYVLISKGKNILPEVVKRLREKGFIIINWFPDYYDSWDWISRNASAYDYFFTPCLYVQQKLLENGIAAYYLPFATDPDPTYTRTEKQYQVTFVGQYTKRRDRLFRRVFEAQLLDVWGYRKWLNSDYHQVYHGQVTAAGSLSIIRKGKITLNTVTCEDDVPIISVNYRPFEASGVGGFVLSWYHEPLEEFFQIGKEIAIFNTAEEALEKTKYYLKHDTAREKIAKAGWRRTVKDHTYKARLKKLFSVVK